MTVDFKALLSKPVDDVKAPVPLPAGTYFGTVSKYSFDESRDKKTPYVRFDLNVTGAGDDIDPEDLKGVELHKKKLRIDYYLTEDALYRLKDFLESCKIPTSGRSLGEAITDTVNCPVLMEVVQQMNQKDPTAMPFNNVRTLRGAE